MELQDGHLKRKNPDSSSKPFFSLWEPLIKGNVQVCVTCGVCVPSKFSKLLSCQPQPFNTCLFGGGNRHRGGTEMTKDFMLHRFLVFIH